MAVNRQTVAKVFTRGLYNNETGGITSFRLNVVKDCTPVSLNHALLRLVITLVSLVITQFSLNNAPITLLIIKTTISLLVISLKKSYSPLICLPSYQTVCYWIVCYWTVCYRTVE